MAPMEQPENDTLHSDASLVMEYEFQNLLDDLRAMMSNLVKLFSLQNDANREPKIGKYLLTNPNNNNAAKCMATILGNSIHEADLALRLSKNQGMSYQSRIYPDKPWRLQQVTDILRGALKYCTEGGTCFLYSGDCFGKLQDSLNQIKEAENLVNGPEVQGELPSHRFVQNFLGEVMYCLKSAKDCLMLPKRRTLEELVKNPSNRCFNPCLPNEIVASFYIQECKLVLAIYHLCTNNNGRVDIANRQQTECIVSWLSDVINILIYALWKCQQVKDKLDMLELIKD